MAIQQHVDMLKKGVFVWNNWRKNNSDIIPDLSGADLAKQKLQNVNFSNTDLSNVFLLKSNLKFADITNANLMYAYLKETDLSKADLSRANLFMTDFSNANLTKVNLSNTNLVNTRFSDTILKRANISKSSLEGMDLSGYDLRGVKFCDSNLRGANLSSADLSYANLKNADISEASIKKARLVDTNVEGTNLSGCNIYGISAWDLILDDSTIQSNLLISKYDELTITVDNLEVAQFIYLMLNNKKIRDIIDTISSKAVLILGRFTPERKEVLDTIKEELRKSNYLPILFDFDKPTSRDTHETITTLARLSKFIIADITDPKSIPQELVTIVHDIPSLPIQPVIKEGNEPWGMYDHIRQYRTVLDVFYYKDKAHLVESLKDKVISMAEKKLQEIKTSF